MTVHGDRNPVEVLQPAGPDAPSRLGPAVVRGLVGAVCLFGLGSMIAPAFLDPSLGFGFFDGYPKADRFFFRFVGCWSAAGFLIGAGLGAVKVAPMIQKTAIGFMLGGLAGVILGDLSHNPKMFAPMLILPGAMIGLFVGFSWSLIRWAWPGKDKGQKPTLWDREADG